MRKEAVIHYHILLYLLGYVEIKVVIGFCSKTGCFFFTHHIRHNAVIACTADDIPLPDTVLLDTE